MTNNFRINSRTEQVFRCTACSYLLARCAIQRSEYESWRKNHENSDAHHHCRYGAIQHGLLKHVRTIEKQKPSAYVGYYLIINNLPSSILTANRFKSQLFRRVTVIHVRYLRCEPFPDGRSFGLERRRQKSVLDREHLRRQVDVLDLIRSKFVFVFVQQQ